MAAQSLAGKTWGGQSFNAIALGGSGVVQLVTADGFCIHAASVFVPGPTAAQAFIPGPTAVQAGCECQS